MRAWGGARRAGTAPGLLVKGESAPTCRVAQVDLARRAGVSHLCVSGVVRGLDKVSEARRERILAAVRELGCTDNGRGHERIAHLRLPPTILYEERAAAMEDAALAPGSSRRAPRAGGTPGRPPAPCSRPGPPTAVFCGNDHMALGALEALRGGGAGRPRGGLRRRLRRSERGRPRRTDDRRPGGRRAGAHRGPLHPPPPGDAGAEEAAGLSRRVPAPVLAVRRATAPPRRAGAVMPAPAARGAQDGGAEDPRTDSPLGGRTSRRCGASGAVMRSMIIRAARPPWAVVDRPTEVREMGGSAAR